MPRILVLNPNTTAAITELVLGHVRRVVPADIELVGATGGFGRPYIGDEAAAAIGAHAALDAYAEHGAGCDAVLLACFGDPGYFALREVADVPVVGLAQASMEAARAAGGRFAIVTGGRKWGPMLERFAACLGVRDALAKVETIELTGAEIAANPAAAIDVLAGACRAAAGHADVKTVVLGGAGLAGLRPTVAAAAGLPVWDSVEVGARTVTERVQARARGEWSKRVD
jgi:allantoin racemase